MLRNLLGLFLGLGLTGVLPLPTVRAGEPGQAVREIRQLLDSEKVACILFPNGPFDPLAFDPDKFDPLMLEATWERVRAPIRELVQRRLEVSLSKDALKLYVGTVAEASSIGPDGAVSRSRRCRIIFAEPNAIVRSVLMDALGLPPECFSNWKRVSEVREMSQSALKVAWEDIGTVTSEFVSASSAVTQWSFAVREPVYFVDKVQLVTSWREYGRRGGYDMFWRLFFQVKRSEQPGKILVAVRGQVGRALPGAATAEIEYLGSEESDSRFDIPLGGRRTEQVDMFVADRPNPGPRPVEPAAVSSSALLAKRLLNDYINRLTK